MTDPSTNSARFAARPIAEGGTPVAAWTQWQRRFPELDVDDCPAMVLVAAHPDDEAAGRAAAAACKATGAPLVEYPIWMWHWATPDDPAVPWHRARRVPLTSGEIVFV